MSFGSWTYNYSVLVIPVGEDFRIGGIIFHFSDEGGKIKQSKKN